MLRRPTTPFLLALALLAAGCAGPASSPAVLESELPIHLEAHLDAARQVGSAAPREAPPTMEWSFDVPQPDWKISASPATDLERTRSAGALRLDLAPAAGAAGELAGSLWVDLPDLRLGDWDYVLLKARATGAIRRIGLRFNHRQRQGGDTDWRMSGEEVNAINDGVEQSYLMRVELRRGQPAETWKQLGIHFDTSAVLPSSLEILSVHLIPEAAKYAAAPFGQDIEGREGVHHRVLYLHPPGRLKYRIKVPPEGRLDVGLGVVGDDRPVRFTVEAEPVAGEPRVLLAETYGDGSRWARRSLDLSDLAGETVDLTLGCDAESAVAVGLWAAPTLAGRRATSRPNILLYLIDGAGADYLSVYGYPRPTTPRLEQLAAEGVVFERAHSNSSWTKPATSTLMTSLHHSVLGGFETLSDPLPDQAVTMAQHLHRAGYQTAVLVSNPFAGRVSNLERGVDTLRDAGSTRNSVSSRDLHQAFWDWRSAFPGEPYWVHFQTTDVHSPHRPEATFADRFIEPQLAAELGQWQRQLEAAGGIDPDSPAWEQTGIDRRRFYDAQRRLYEACMAHNDEQIGLLVDRLKESGEWHDTLLIVTSDHGPRAAGLRIDGLSPKRRLLASAYETRIPLLVVAPGRLAPGRRIPHPVSLIDLLPTVLELADLPPAEISQGRSLVPLLRGEPGWEPRPVILDEFDVDRASGGFKGSVEVIDEWWGAALRIGLDDGPEPSPPVLLFDLRQDPFAQNSLHLERPDLAAEYGALLRRTLRDHRQLGERFSRSQGTNLTADQLSTLRHLGYIQ